MADVHPSVCIQTERYFDLTGSLTYISLVIVALVLGLADARSLLLGATVLLWAVRLGSFCSPESRRQVRIDDSGR